MAEIVNLNRARKAKAKIKKGKTAEANRVAHGTPKALKKLEVAKLEQASERLVGHRLEVSRDDN